MKKIITILVAVMLTASGFAQTPEKMSYQAVIRNSSNQLIINTQVGMQISILQGAADGTPVYTETQLPSTNAEGLLTLEIGTGTTSDNFSSIDWSANSYFIKTETDPAGGTNYTITGTSQLMSVPYALYSKTAENGISTAQTTDITTNNAKVSDVNHVASSTTDNLTEGTTNLYYTEARVSANSDVVANTAKISNATHTGDVTGNEALTISDNAVDGTDISLAAEVDGDMMTFDGTNWVAKNILVESSGVSQSVDNRQPYLAVNYIIALNGQYPERNSISDPTMAEITIFAGNFAPLNWAFCNGQLLSTSNFSALFSLLGTTYGGNGTTSFALPDLRGRVAIHAGNSQGPGLPNYSLGQKGGLSEVQLPAHTHTIIYQ